VNIQNARCNNKDLHSSFNASDFFVTSRRLSHHKPAVNRSSFIFNALFAPADSPMTPRSEPRSIWFVSPQEVCIAKCYFASHYET